MISILGTNVSVHMMLYNGNLLSSTNLLSKLFSPPQDFAWSICSVASACVETPSNATLEMVHYHMIAVISFVGSDIFSGDATGV